jgi:hypothetical protein
MSSASVTREQRRGTLIMLETHIVMSLLILTFRQNGAHGLPPLSMSSSIEWVQIQICAISLRALKLSFVLPIIFRHVLMILSTIICFWCIT